LKCGGKIIGRVLFPLVGIGQFYDYNVGFEQYDNKPEVYKIVKGFKNSACSQEVKFTIQQLAQIYGFEW